MAQIKDYEVCHLSLTYIESPDYRGVTALLQFLIEFILIMVSGILGGLVGSLTGLGGGTVVVPLLSLFLGVPIYFAAAAGLFSSIATSAGSASRYTREKIANLKIGIGLQVATTIGVIVGSIIAILVYTNGFDAIIYIIFGAVLLGSLVPVVRRGKTELPEEMEDDNTTRIFQLKGTYFDSKMKKNVSYTGVRWWIGEFIMFFAGLLAGLLGIGGGALNVLAMDATMNLPMKVATTTSNFMVGITAATGASIYWYEGYIQFFVVAATVLGVLIGAFLGAKILTSISNTNIRWIFFSVLSFLGVEMVLRGLNYSGTLVLNSTFTLGVSLTVAIVLIVLLYYYTKSLGVKERKS